ncbi:MAG: molybdopterin-dependent oxidoreductase [Negativicutes bacterium]|nr:molybdopterin-dependent oxidoreductase [Negativicutes bacterium]
MSMLKVLNTPVFAAEGVLHLEPKTLTLAVDGLAAGSRSFSLEQLKGEFPAETVNMRLTSVSGWSVRADWNGLLWHDFVRRVGPAESARYALFYSGSEYTTCVLLSDLAASHSMLVWGVGGEPLEDEYGGPLRTVIPNLWGYKSCKWLTRISFVEKYVTGYWELRGYTHRGEIEPGETFDVNSQKYRAIPGGEVTQF